MKLNILFVEDENEIRKNISNYIEALYEYKIIEAVDGWDAWKKYLNAKPEVIITDIEMPNLNGIEFIKKVREIDKNVKIIVLTAYDEKEKLRECIKLNLVDYLIKPLNRKSLNTLLEKLEKDLKCELFSDRIYLDDSVYFDRQKNIMVQNNKDIKLTKKETLLIKLLISSKGQPVSSYDIHNYVYDLETEFNINALRTLIKKVRKKLPIDSIENIYGGSYKIKIIY